MDNNIALKHQVAQLESKLDLMEAELSHLNALLVDCGFPEGVKTLRTAIEELVEEGIHQIFPPRPQAEG